MSFLTLTLFLQVTLRERFDIDVLGQRHRALDREVAN